MKKIISWLSIIGFIIVVIGSCAKKDDSTTTTAAKTYISTDTTASGSITVGSETMSGTYVTECITSVNTMISEGSLPSEAKAWGGAVVVTGNDNISQETISYTDTSCTAVSHYIKTFYDNVSVGSASGSNYPLTLTKKSQAWLANTTTAETWLETLVSNELDFIVGTVYDVPYGGSSNPRYGLMTLNSTTLQFASISSESTPSSIDGALSFTKR